MAGDTDILKRPETRVDKRHHLQLNFIIKAVAHTHTLTLTLTHTHAHICSRTHARTNIRSHTFADAYTLRTYS
jgi:hypothetical protein